MDISEAGLKLIEEFEGYSYHAYWDRWGRVWTVGYGETENVGSNSTQTRVEAEADLKRRLINEYEPAIKALGVNFNQNQFDALCSFVWNLGPGSMRWDVGRYCQAGQFAKAADAMLQYTHAGGVVLAGLVRRRQEERALFLKPAVPLPPPDLHYYDRYPVGPFYFDNGHGFKFHLSERATCLQYDSLWSARKRDMAAIGDCRAHLKILRNRISWVYHNRHPHWFDAWHLGWRNARMKERLSGGVVLTDNPWPQKPTK